MSARLSVGQETRKLPSQSLHLSSLSSGDPEMGKSIFWVTVCSPLPLPSIPSNPIQKPFWPHLKTEFIPSGKAVTSFSPLYDSKEVVQGKLCGFLTLICSVPVLSSGPGSSPSLVFALLFPSASLDLLAAGWAVALQGYRRFIYTFSCCSKVEKYKRKAS